MWAPLGLEEQGFTLTESVFVGVGQCPQMPGDMEVDNLPMRLVDSELASCA